MMGVVELASFGLIQDRSNASRLGKTFITAALEPDNRERACFSFSDTLQTDFLRPAYTHVRAVEELPLLGDAVGGVIQQVWLEGVVVVETIVDWLLTSDDCVRRQRIGQWAGRSGYLAAVVDPDADLVTIREVVVPLDAPHVVNGRTRIDSEVIQRLAAVGRGRNESKNIL